MKTELHHIPRLEQLQYLTPYHGWSRLKTWQNSNLHISYDQNKTPPKVTQFISENPEVDTHVISTHLGAVQKQDTNNKHGHKELSQAS